MKEDIEEKIILDKLIQNGKEYENKELSPEEEIRTIFHGEGEIVMNYQDTFTPEEWTRLKEIMSSIHHHIPEQHMHLVWNSYQRIEKVNTPQPCSCASSAKHWITAVNTINNFIKEQGV